MTLAASIPESQAEVATFLAGLAGTPPIQTHISAIFVGRNSAWKMKKAVALGFLDFSTLAAREHFCWRELELNQPTAPGIYRDVVPITRAQDGSLQEGGSGEAVEWVLRMAPIPAGDFLDAVAARGALTPALLDALGDAVFALHQAAPKVTGLDAPGAMARVLAGNLRAACAAGLPEAALAPLAARFQAALEGAAPMLAARAAEGRIRRCHGDLHLGNLCLWQGKPTPFDALEFDEALARIDTGYDLAFLLMDLDRQAWRAAANRVFNRYVARSGDYGVLGLLPFWLGLRALVRAHVEAARGRDGVPLLRAATDYLAPPPPRLIAVGGLQGTGKSTLARGLAPALGAAPGAVLLRTDELRKRRFGLTPEAPLPPDAYTEAISAAIHEELFMIAEAALRQGHAVALDAMFLDARHRREAAAMAARVGAPFQGFWLEAPMEILKSRILARRGDASDATIAVLERAAQAEPGPIDWLRLDAAGDALAAACKALGVAG
ncbi:MAG: AAA family ATPase [Roseomonas sp.]|nr:AAA family ATPase [Roseomonas sp.]